MNGSHRAVEKEKEMEKYVEYLRAVGLSCLIIPDRYLPFHICPNVKHWVSPAVNGGLWIIMIY